jgi:hypothetical protein
MRAALPAGARRRGSSWQVGVIWVFWRGVKVIVFLLGVLLAVTARADAEAEAHWLIDTWVLDVDRTVKSFKPNSMVPKDSIEKFKTFLSSLLITLTADTLTAECPADDLHEEIDVRYTYTIVGTVKQKVLLRGKLGANSVERIVFDFESQDACSVSLKFLEARLYLLREKEE